LSGMAVAAPVFGRRSNEGKPISATSENKGGLAMSATNTRGVSRRRFLNLLGGSAAIPYLMRAGSPRAAGLSGKITMIKGPHSADEAKYEAEIIDDFKKANPNAEVEFTTY